MGKKELVNSFSVHLFHEQNDRKNLFLYIEEMSEGGHSQTDFHKKDQSSASNLFQSGETLVDVLDCELCLKNDNSELPQNTALSLSMFDDCDRNQVSHTSLDSCTLFTFDVLMIGSQVHTQSPFHRRYEVCSSHNRDTCCPMLRTTLTTSFSYNLNCQLLTTLSERLDPIIARYG